MVYNLCETVKSNIENQKHLRHVNILNNKTLSLEINLHLEYFSHKRKHAYSVNMVECGVQRLSRNKRKKIQNSVFTSADQST